MTWATWGWTDCRAGHRAEPGPALALGPVLILGPGPALITVLITILIIGPVAGGVPVRRLPADLAHTVSDEGGDGEDS